MHAEAYEWVGQYASREVLTALEVGGRNINGTGRDHFPMSSWTVLDIQVGPGVTVVADAAEWTPDREYDLVLCTEVFEHTPAWREIVNTTAAALRKGGRVVVTAAGPGRAPHSAHDGAALQPDEWYENLDPGDLEKALTFAGFEHVVVDVREDSHDVRATGVKHG